MQREVILLIMSSRTVTSRLIHILPGVGNVTGTIFPPVIKMGNIVLSIQDDIQHGSNNCITVKIIVRVSMFLQ